MYSRYIILPFMLMQMVCCAQSVTWAASGTLDNKSNYTKVIGENSHGIFLLKYKNRNLKKHFTIEQFSHRLTFVKRKTIKIPGGKLEKITVTANGILYFTSNSSEQAGNNILAAWLLDSALNISEGPVVVQRAPANGYASYPDFYIDYAMSRKVLSAFYAQPGTDNTSTIFNIAIINTTLEGAVDTKQLVVSQEYDKISIRNTLVDHYGNYYVLYMITKTKRGSGADNFENHLLCYNAKSGQTQDYIINNSQTYIGEHSLDFDEANNKVIVSGFFGYKSPEANHGIFMIGIDAATQQVLHRSFNDIDRTLVGKLVGQKYADRGEDLSKFVIRKIVPRSDGGIVLVAERYYITTENQVYYINGIPQNSSVRIYNYDEILVFSVNMDGTVDWNDVINKKQASGNDGGYFSSVLVTVTKNNLYIVYNDRLNTTADVLQITYDDNGRKEQKILLQSDAYYALVIPVEARQVGYKSTVTPVVQNKNYTLAKINY